MSDIIRKIGLFGIGVMAMTQEKVEEFASDMVVKGEMNKEEGKKLVRDIIAEKDRQVKEIGEMINQKVKDTVEKSGLATKRDVDGLNKRIESIEKKFNF